jgi:hypothetical protein
MPSCLPGASDHAERACNVMLKVARDGESWVLRLRDGTGAEESSDGVALPSARRVLLYEVRQRLDETAAQHGCPATVTQRSSDQHQPRPATTPIALQPYRWACWHTSHTFGQHESAKGARVVYAEDLRRMLSDLLHRDLFRGPGGLGVPCGVSSDR